MPTTVPSPIALEPPDATSVHTAGGLIADMRRAVVATTDILGGLWSTVEYLYVTRLKVTAAPDIDECTMAYSYGPQMRENDSSDDPGTGKPKQFDPLDLIGKYCRVTVPDAGQDGSDIVWYGVIESDLRQPMGDQPEGSARGMQQFHAMGLLRLLELTTIVSGTVNNYPHPASPGPQDDTIQIGYGLQFNGAAKVEYDDRGNQSLLPDETSGQFTFSERTQGGQLWDANSATQYLLQYNFPVDSAGDAVCDWQLNSDPSFLDWYDITARTDLKNVKAVLDELISRKRGVSYFVTYTEPSDSVKGSTRGMATVNVFNFVDTPIPLPNVTAIPANPNQRSLDFENAFDIEASLTNSVAQQYDQIIVLGAYRTTTCTMLFGPLSFSPDWSVADETDYKNAAVSDADYSGLEAQDKWERNTKYRKTDKLKHVYSRFRLDPAFPGYVNSPADGQNYALAPKLVDSGDGSSLDGSMYFGGVFYHSMTVGQDTLPIWNRGLIIEHHLPFKDRGDYSGTKIADKTFEPSDDTATDDGEPNWEFIKPFIFMPTYIEGAIQKFQLLDQLSGEHLTGANSCKCPWSASATILDKRPAIDLRVSGAPQQIISPTSFAGASGAVNPSEDPAVSPNLCATDYTNFIATVAFRLPHRVQIKRSVGDTSDNPPGRIQRTLYIQLPDARLDYVIPGTFVLIKNGLKVQTDTGGNVRDDRDRMRGIAEAAAAWYGRPRQTIELTVRQIAEVVKLGWLITDVGADYQLTGVNTPITGITYDFHAGTTTFQTAFADLEFQMEAGA